MGLEFKAVSLMVLCLFNQALICQNTCLLLAILEDFEVDSTLVKEVNLTLLLLILLETTNFTTHLLHPYVQVCCCFLWLFPKLWEIVITVLPIEERLFQSPFKWPKYDFGFSLVHWWSKIFQCSHGSSLQQPVNCECLLLWQFIGHKDDFHSASNLLLSLHLVTGLSIPFWSFLIPGMTKDCSFRKKKEVGKQLVLTKFK